jgi:hypothetical protein
MSMEIVKIEPNQIVASNQLSSRDLVAQVSLIQDVMRSVMKDGEHFGKIPGCGDKPTLLKAGAEKLGFTFRLSPAFTITKTDLHNGHREYEVVCSLTHINTGQIWGHGVGSCSTMESKYRYRSVSAESTGKPVPKDYWKDRDPSLLGGKGFIAQKIDGQWMICAKGDKVENENPADQYNTVLKMAKKRALVDAMLTCTAASDIFTQDIEDFAGSDNVQEAVVVTEEKKQPPASQPKQEEKPKPKVTEKPAETYHEKCDRGLKWLRAHKAAQAYTDLLSFYNAASPEDIPEKSRDEFLARLRSIMETVRQQQLQKQAKEEMGNAYPITGTAQEEEIDLVPVTEEMNL